MDTEGEVVGGCVVLNERRVASSRRLKVSIHFNDRLTGKNTVKRDVWDATVAG